tara:strand:+ start:28 stop:453 length:426 start_codon:yes stop_codon:yes gene_type:complete
VKFKFRPTVKKDREATDKEKKCIENTEKMLRNTSKLPPKTQMARNIAVEHWRSLKAYIRGQQVITTPEEAKRRWEICKRCPHLLYDEVNPDTDLKDGRCTHCGCFMNVKVHYAVAECPIDKWNKDCGHQCDCTCEDCPKNV